MPRLINTLEVLGGSYCEALPDGRWMSVPRLGGKIRSSGGDLDPAGLLPLYARLRPQLGLLGPFVAGQVAGNVIVPGPIFLPHGSYGTSPVAWDEVTGDLWTVGADGQIRVVDPAAPETVKRILPYPGAQGLRWVRDGAYATGDGTYARERMNEFTRLNLAEDVFVGQGGQGLAIERRGILHQIATGDTRFPRVNFSSSNDVIAIGYWNIAEDKSVMLWLRLEDVSTFPIIPVAAPPPVVIPPPPPPPGEPPVFSIPGPGEGLALVERIHREVAPPQTIVGAFRVTKRVAWALRDRGCGLLEKPGGDNIVEWHGKWFSAGRIVFPNGHLFKVIRDVGDGGAVAPSWQDEGVDPALIPRWVAPMDPVDGNPIPPPTDPTPPPLTMTHVAYQVDDETGAGEVGQIIPHHDRPLPFYCGILRPNGKKLCITPDGTLEDRDGLGGWELFRLVNGRLVAERDGRVYVR